MITLKVNGTAFEGWKTARVTAGVDRAARDFELGLSDRFPIFTPGANIKAGDECTIEVDGQTVVTGYVDDVSVTYDDRTHSYTVSGRSKTQDLIDCSAMNKPGQWKGLNLLDVCKQLAQPFGLSVSVSGKEKPEVVKDFSIQQGETAFAAIERLCRLQGFLASDDEDGNIVITRVGSDSSSGTIQCTPLGIGNNVKRGSSKVSYKDRYSKYTVKGQQAGSDDLDGDAAATPNWSLSDSNVKRYRPLLVVAEGQTSTDTARKRVAWERSTRAGKSVELNYEVAGWTTSQGGELWKVNTLVPVNDSILGINGEFLIAEATYSIGPNGTTTSLRLTPPEAYQPEPEADLAKKKKTSESVDSWADEESDE